MFAFLLPILDVVGFVIDHVPFLGDWFSSVDWTALPSPDRSPHGGH